MQQWRPGQICSRRWQAVRAAPLLAPVAPPLGRPLARAPQGHRPNPSRQQMLTCRAFPETIDGLLTTAAVAAGIVGVLASFLSTTALDELPDRRGDGDDDDFKWAVMGVVSCIPLFNWMAWVFGALDFTGEPNPRAQLYYFYAALYALPLLRSGFELDSFTWGMLLLGVVQLQVERMAVTEPQELEELASKLSVAKAIKAGASRLLEAAKWTPVRKILKEEERRGLKELQDSRELEREELSRFDRQLQEKERRQRQLEGRNQQQGGKQGGKQGGGGKGPKGSSREH